MTPETTSIISLAFSETINAREIPQIMFSEEDLYVIQKQRDLHTGKKALIQKSAIFMALSEPENLHRVVSRDEINDYINKTSIFSVKVAKSDLERQMQDERVKVYTVWGRGMIILPNLADHQIIQIPHLAINYQPNFPREEHLVDAYKTLARTFVRSRRSNLITNILAKEEQNLLDYMYANRSLNYEKYHLDKEPLDPDSELLYCTVTTLRVYINGIRNSLEKVGQRNVIENVRDKGYQLL